MPELDEAALKLEGNNFTSLAERRSHGDCPAASIKIYQAWVVD
jgi:hypothetical protein